MSSRVSTETMRADCNWVSGAILPLTVSSAMFSSSSMIRSVQPVVGMAASAFCRLTVLSVATLSTPMRISFFRLLKMPHPFLL